MEIIRLVLYFMDLNPHMQIENMVAIYLKLKI